MPTQNLIIGNGPIQGVVDPPPTQRMKVKTGLTMKKKFPITKEEIEFINQLETKVKDLSNLLEAIKDKNIVVDTEPLEYLITAILYFDDPINGNRDVDED